jgi:tetratricopeptide (TPR) repeat protein
MPRRPGPKKRHLDVACMIDLRVLLASAGALFGGACLAPGGPKPDPAADRAAAERELRRLFPEIEGEIDRDSIRAQLQREQAAADPAAGVRSSAIEAISKGEFDRARDLLGELLAGAEIERARALLAAGDARGALASLDRALEMAPHSDSVRCLRGEAALAVFDQHPEPGLCESALANFTAAADGAHGSPADPPRTVARGCLGASRASLRLGRVHDARSFASRGLGAGPAGSLAEALHRSFAEASFDEYLGERSAGSPAESIAARARESRDALEALLGRTPEDPWTWDRLAQLAQTQGSLADARDLTLEGLEIVPDDAALLGRLSAAARAIGGPAFAAGALEPYCARHPDLAAPAWQFGLAQYDAGIEELDASRDPGSRLSAAEAAFGRCRGLDPGREADCRSLEAQARGARGVWLLARGDLAGAQKAFLSMQDAVKGGIALEIRGTSQRGTDGLFRLAETFGQRGDPGNPGSIDSLEQAARICDLLHQVDPKDARFAAASGRFHRDTAVALELRASASRDAKSDATRTAAADRLLDQARELMEKAFEASRDAVELSPDDERAAAQAGAILARYLQRDPEKARLFLESAVEIGQRKVAALLAAVDEKGIPESELHSRRKRLEDEQTLVGDACKDLGVLHLDLLGDAAKASEWFQRARKADPDPRPEIDGLLDRCEKARRGELDPRLRDEDRWAPKTHAARKT